MNAETAAVQQQLVSHPDTISRPTKLILTLSTAIVLTISTYYSPTTTALLPIILTPTLLLLRYRSRSIQYPQRVPLSTILWIYLGTTTISTLLLILVQSALAYLAASILFGPDRDWFLNELQNVNSESDIRDDTHRVQRVEFARRPSYLVFVAIMTFGLAGLCEEVQKYYSIVLAVRFRGRNWRRLVEIDVSHTDVALKAVVSATEREYLMYGVTTGLAFAAVEMYMFVVGSATKPTITSSYELVRLVAERLCVGTVAHLLCGLSTALNMVRRDIRKEKIGVIHVVGRSAFYHGLVDFTLMGFSTVSGNVGWVHPEDSMGTLICWAMSTCVIGFLGWLVWKDLQEMRLNVE